MRRRFTLIELLVVSAIIAILMSMLIPALSKARERTKSLACANNLKQLAMGWHQFIIDNDDKLPPVETGPSTVDFNSRGFTEPHSGTGASWIYLIKDYIAMPDISLNANPRFTSLPVKYRSGILHCPSSNEFPTGTYSSQYGLFHYDIGGVRAYGAVPISKITQIKRPSVKGVMADSKNSNVSYTGCHIVYNNGAYLSFRHGKNRINMAIADGHVEGFSYLDYKNHLTEWWKDPWLGFESLQ